MVKFLASVQVFCFLITSALAQKTDLVSVIENDDLRIFKESIHGPPSLEVFNLAIKKAALKIVDYCIGQEVTLNDYDSLDKFPLLEAVRIQNQDLVLRLLNAGANVNMKERKGLQGTALMYAVSNKSVGISELLIEKGAAVNALDVNEDPALNWATYYGNVAMMHLLINNGANLSLQSKHGRAVDVCYRLWHADSVAQVFRYHSDKVISAKEIQLIEAVRVGDTRNTQKFLKQGANPNGRDVLGTPLIHLAAEKGYIDIVRLLLSKGAQVDILNSVGQSAMAYAARFGQMSIVEEFLANKGNPNSAGELYGLTPLIGAAVNGNSDMGILLLNSGANINHIDSVNQSAALHWAMFYNNIPFAKMLLDRGADYKQTVLAGEFNARSLAKAYEYKELVDHIDQLENKKNPLYGSWKMKQIQYQYADTTYIVEMEYPGRLMIDRDKYSIMYNPYGAPRRHAEKLSKLEESEMVYAFKTMVFNSGSYVMDHNTLTTTADMAKVAGFEGGMQYYRFKKDEGDLHLTMYDETYPDGQKPDWYQKLEILFILEQE